MKTMLKFVTLFMLALCCTNAVQAFEYKTSNCNEGQAINNQKIDQVITNEQGVFLLVGCNWIRVDGMQATSNGILILQEGTWISLSEIRNRDNYYVWQCPICGTWNVQNGGSPKQVVLSKKVIVKQENEL